MKKLSILIGTSLLLFACGGNEETTETDDTTGETTTEEVVEEEPIIEEVHPLAELHLNDGAKWQVDAPTDAGMKKVQEIIDAFEGEDFVALGTEIKEELSNIISQCAMEGEAHEQYHVVLHGLMKESKLMKKGESEDFDWLTELMAAYDEYFELGDE